MKKDLFNAIVILATQGENAKISHTKVATYEKFVVKILDELNTALEQLFSENTAVRKKAVAFLGSRPNMNLMRNDADIAREWFLVEDNREKIFEAVMKEQDENILDDLLSAISAVCKRFAITNMAFRGRPTDMEYLKKSYELLNSYLDCPQTAICLSTARALTLFRLPKAWNKLYSLLSEGKLKSNQIEKIAISLYYFGRNRLRKQGDTMIQILDQMEIDYEEFGISDNQAKAFSELLLNLYPTRISASAKSAIIRAFYGIGNKDTIYSLKQIAMTETDEFRLREIKETIAGLYAND